MKHAFGDIWDFFEEGWCVAIPTNVGFAGPQHHGVLGAGLAKQAADRFPELRPWWGEVCYRLCEDTGVVQWEPDKRLIMFPTKPFDAGFPNLSWKQKSDPALIQRGLVEFSQRFEGVAVPLFGCGCGELDPKDVLPMMGELLDDRFTLVETRRRCWIRMVHRHQIRIQKFA